VAVSPAIDAETTKMLNTFQRDARDVLERLLPFLHGPRLYPDAVVEGWGDVRGGRAAASTVVLTSPKAVKPPESTKQLARLRLEVGDRGEWTATVSVVAQADERCAWPPASEAAWWIALREKLRTGIVGYRGASA
jgi:hypothetical protein